MAIIARVLAILRVMRNGAQILDVKARTASGAKWYEHAQSAGLDAPPLEGIDSALVHSAEGTGRGTISGYFDPKNEGTALGGEYRVYSRDEGGEVRAQGHLFRDGTIRLWNDKGSIEIEAGGTVVINGWRIDPDGNGTAAGGQRFPLDGDVLTKANVSLDNHLTEGSPTAPDGAVSDTGKPIPG